MDSTGLQANYPNPWNPFDIIKYGILQPLGGWLTRASGLQASAVKINKTIMAHAQGMADAGQTVTSYYDPCQAADDLVDFGSEVASQAIAGAAIAKVGRLGNTATRKNITELAKDYESKGWTVTGGGGSLREEYLKPLSGGRAGGSYADITPQNGNQTLRINTVDTLADGITPTGREVQNAARIMQQAPNDILLLIPKP